MCGIFCSLSRNRYLSPSDKLAERLRGRGPDSQASVQLICSASTAGHGRNAGGDTYVTLYSTVLSLRGDATVQQPYQDDSTKYSLCWNGEAWSIAGDAVKGNDTQTVHRMLVQALQAPSVNSSPDPTTDAARIAQALSAVAGPYAFLFLDHVHSTLYFGRDVLGRRSLLFRTSATGDIIISSVSDGSVDGGWTELDADGIYCIDLSDLDAALPLIGAKPPPSSGLGVTPIPYNFSPSLENGVLTSSVIPQLSLNTDIPYSQAALDENSASVATLETFLRTSLTLRATNIPEPPSTPNMTTDVDRARLAILFSGGLDCTILARMSDELLPASEPIDLLNVAFENPRIRRNRSNDTTMGINIFELCPDRITGRASHAELQRICPGRIWRFVSINVPYAEFVEHRENVISLMHPHNTEMDLSIASALYFAARGQGEISGSFNSPSTPYATKARVLLSGLGADEIFAGYTRHGTAFKRNGFAGLLDELQLDVARLGKRNLGRDDRAMSHWSKEVRYPYLDERLLGWALQASVTEKCGFGEPEDKSGNNGAVALEPGKKALRCLAWKLGMKDVATEKKRAIQFGARTAKMETGKTKGTHMLS